MSQRTKCQQQKALIHCLSDDILSAEVLPRMPWCDRARAATVCRRWRRVVSTPSHAALVWSTLEIQEGDVHADPSDEGFKSPMQWCQAHNGHIQQLHIYFKPYDTESWEDTVYSDLLGEVCSLLLSRPDDSRLLQLSILQCKDNGGSPDSYFALPAEALSALSFATALQRLTLALPDLRHLMPLAAAVHSLQRLKIVDVQHEWGFGDEYETTGAAGVLAGVLCARPLLQELKLQGLHLRKLPAELATAIRLRTLVLCSRSHEELNVLTGSLPTGLSRLRLTECCEEADGNDWVTEAVKPITPEWPHDFDNLAALKELQLTARGRGPRGLPSGLTSLRLEAPAEHDAHTLGYFNLLSRISELAQLQMLHLHGFDDLGRHQQDLTAALSTLHRLRALVGSLGLSIEPSSRSTLCGVVIHRRQHQAELLMAADALGVLD